jgi:hypothetical protein
MKILYVVFLSIAMVVLAAGSAAAGDEGFISVFADESGTNCNFYDNGGVITAFVIYKGPLVTSAAQFKLEPSHGAEMTYMSETVPAHMPGGNMGRADTGISVVFGGCVDPPVHMLTVHYMGLGVSGTCGKLKVVKDPQDPISGYPAGTVVMVHCEGHFGTRAYVRGGHGVVNPDESCQCDAEWGGSPTPVAQATWGGIKAMYVD